MTVFNLLESLKNENETIHFKPNPGNSGDALMAASAFDLFDQLNLKYNVVDNDGAFNPTNKVIIYGGGGNFIERYSDAADFITQCHPKAKKFILFPHTIAGRSGLIESFKSNVILFSRERNSFDYLQSLNSHCHFHLDMDLAFSVDINKYLNLQPGIIPKINYLRIRSKHLLERGKKTLNAYRTDDESTSVQIPNDNIDVSKVFTYTYQQDVPHLVRQKVTDFLTFISYWDVVNTNRLHVAIAAALLQKEVNLFPNNYWKNKAVYDYSLKGFSNVKFHKKNPL